jgi:YbaB/EbfC DNA-binding family protein
VLGRDLESSADTSRAAAALADRIATLTSSADGDRGAIRVTVAGSGNLTGLELDDRVQAYPGADLAAAILRVMRRAQAGLVDRVAGAVEDTVGTDSDTGRTVLDSFAQRFATTPEEPPSAPVMPSPPPFPTFQNRPTLPHQSPGVGFESGRDSRAR